MEVIKITDLLDRKDIEIHEMETDDFRQITERYLEWMKDHPDLQNIEWRYARAEPKGLTQLNRDQSIGLKIPGCTTGSCRPGTEMTLKILVQSEICNESDLPKLRSTACNQPSFAIQK